MNKPLEGLKVLELARVLAGPWVGQTLADLGADVIKVESPQGDDTRTWGPPFVERKDDKSAAYFHACNRGKRSIALNFKEAADREIVIELVKQSDVLVENFKLNGLKKYGLDYETLKQINPRLIYCSITGFGQTGPYASQPGYDFIVQGMSGMMSITGEPGREPQKIGTALADIMTGLYATIGIQAALWQRERTGLGQQVDLALLDSMVGVLANQAMNYLVSGVAPQRMGNAHPNIVPYQVLEVKNGHIILAVGNDGQFQRLCHLLQLDHLSTDEAYATNSARQIHREALTKILAEAFAKWDKLELLDALHQCNVPAGPINNIDEVFADPQVISRGMQLDLDGVPGVRTPITFSDAELTLNEASPKVDQHRAEILAELKNNKQ
ncbi:CaiB/BaiF CoA-transferase family protein [uncultured Maritalea sp.]|uniref:CaiB/BaiF CoA transferase family protein n=1 Tax=uncultured Maritalea sp. TaxID=757249 RepID=UPI00262CD55C|nr:CaiB/BaiF CoA-transferase family protein [uncultured Maritalea sp.]